ncbi:MAG: T9SS type A sorting domain-containing protein, partial [Salinivirgaceae bacterium]|nr:T9SS type A sorting domain-containing protein [Salinivirgaceae bacterium]
GAIIGDAVILDVENEDLTDDATYPYWNEVSTLKINLGAISEELTVEVLITAQNVDGSLICNSLIPDYTATFSINPVSAVYYSEANESEKTMITEGQEFTVCRGTSDLKFYYGFYNQGSFNYTSANWFRDELEQVAQNAHTFNSYDVSGAYHVELLSTGDCSDQTSVSFNIVINEKPEIPEITAEGNLNACEGEIVTLTATEGFTYYRWTRNNKVMNVYTQAIEVEETGVYRVQVSNVPFAQNCFSVLSNPVEIIIHEFYNIAFATTEIELCRDEATAKVTISASQTDVTYYLKDESTDVTFAAIVGTGGSITFTTNAMTAEMQQFYLEAVWDLKPECSKIVNVNTLSITTVPDYSIIIKDPITNLYELTEDGVEYCEGATLAVGTIDNLTGAPVNNVTWYKDGYSIAGSTISNAEAGVYKVRYLPQTGDCEYFTSEITVNKVERPTIVNNGNLEFCEGQEELILTATPGHAKYEWYNYNSGPISNVESTDNELHVSTTGKYRVIAVSEDGCKSESSLYVDVAIHRKPLVPNNYRITEDVLCEPGYVNVTVNFAETNVMYHLYNIETGNILSTPVIGNSNLVLSTTDSIKENVTMAIAAKRVDVEACEVTSLPFDIEVYNLTIEMYSNVLFANIPDASVTSYKWFRNGVAVTNGGDKSELTIFDDAAYSVRVTTDNGCTLETATKKIVEPYTEKSATFTIYPNPVNNEMNLSLTNLYGNVDVHIIDITGKVCGVFNYTIEESEVEVVKTLNLNSLTKGFFTIEINSEKSKQIKHFIKN